MVALAELNQQLASKGAEPEAAARLVAASLPLVAESLNVTAVGEQLVRQRPSTAATVLCNSYHAGRAVLLCDALP